jgi:hypothetical protein
VVSQLKLFVYRKISYVQNIYRDLGLVITEVKPLGSVTTVNLLASSEIEKIEEMEKL